MLVQPGKQARSGLIGQVQTVFIDPVCVCTVVNVEIKPIIWDPDGIVRTALLPVQDAPVPPVQGEHNGEIRVKADRIGVLWVRISDVGVGDRLRIIRNRGRMIGVVADRFLLDRLDLQGIRLGVYDKRRPGDRQHRPLLLRQAGPGAAVEARVVRAGQIEALRIVRCDAHDRLGSVGKRRELVQIDRTRVSAQTGLLDGPVFGLGGELLQLPGQLLPGQRRLISLFREDGGQGGQQGR